jgi:hypothetical protein
VEQSEKRMDNDPRKMELVSVNAKTLSGARKS